MEPNPPEVLWKSQRRACVPSSVEKNLPPTIEQDYLENSVSSGIALVGGIWTFLNGLFAVIFGSTLLLVLFGIKPLSVYGLLHNCRRKRGSLLLPRHAPDTQQQERMMQILHEHLIDVDDLEANKSNEPVQREQDTTPYERPLSPDTNAAESPGESDGLMANSMKSGRTDEVEMRKLDGSSGSG